MVANQAQQAEIESLKKLNWSDIQSRPVLPQTNPGIASSSKPVLTTGIEKIAGGDVVMTDAYPKEYESSVPMFDGESNDVEVLVRRLERYFSRYLCF